MRAVAISFPPCEGGVRGGGPHSLRIVSVFAVRPQRRPETTRLAARPRTRRRPHRSIAPSTPLPCTRGSPVHPPWPPLHKGGKERERSRNLRNEFGRSPRVRKSQLCTNPGPPSHSRARAISGGYSRTAPSRTCRQSSCSSGKLRTFKSTESGKERCRRGRARW